MTPEKDGIDRHEFISIALHQLRTPLTGTLWALKMLLNGEMGAITDEQRKYLLMSQDGIKKTLARLTDVLLIEKSNVDFVKYSFEPENFKDFIQELITSVLPHAESKRIRLELKAPNNLPLIPIDKEKLYGTIQNIFENAINYSHPDSTIFIDINEDKENLVLAITDTGIGIPTEEQEQVFQRFFRGSNTKMAPHGTGIGLSIGKHIIEQHGGKLWFTSIPEKGSTFYLSLPFKKDLI
jgi:signal transduction histidine kinase